MPFFLLQRIAEYPLIKDVYTLTSRPERDSEDGQKVLQL